eukprot:284034_1
MAAFVVTVANKQPSVDVQPLAATTSQQFEFPSTIPLTPTLCSVLFQEFIKQILYTKGQIPMLYNELTKGISDSQSNHKRLTSRGLKLNHLSKAMEECQTSLRNMFEYHYTNTQQRIVFIDVLLLFGKTYKSPLETYSLRFYMNSNEKNTVNEKERKAISRIIARNLHQVTKIWDKELPITECRVCANICNNNESDQHLNDPNFLLKRDLCLRFASQKKKNAKKANVDNNLFLMNFWNQDTLECLNEQMIVVKGDKNKENAIPCFQIHDLQRVKGENNGECNTNPKAWFLSKFKIKGIA